MRAIEQKGDPDYYLAPSNPWVVGRPQTILTTGTGTYTTNTTNGFFNATTTAGTPRSAAVYTNVASLPTT